MTIKAFLNAISKSKPKPKVFPKGTKKFTKGEARSLLEEAQVQIEAIQSGKQKPLKIDDFSDEMLVDTSKVSPTLAPDKVQIGTKVKAPKPNQKHVDDFLDEERKLFDEAETVPLKESEFFNINKIQASSDIVKAIERLAKQDKAKIIERTRGKVTWKETDKLASLLDINHETAVANLLKLRPGKPLNATEIKWARKLIIDQGKKLDTLAKQLISETGDDVVALEFARTHALLTHVTRNFLGAKTELARAFNILREPVKEPGAFTNLKLDQLNRQNILMNLGGKDQLKNIAELYLSTPTLTKKIAFAEKSFLSKSSDAAVEVFLNNILFAGFTHVKNVSGNWILKSMVRTERNYAAWRYGGKELDGIAEYEGYALGFGEHIATTGMWKALAGGFSRLSLKRPLELYKKFPGFDSQIAGTKFEAPPNALSGDAFKMQEGPFRTFIDVFGKVVTGDRLPYRWLQTGDNYFKNQAYISEIYAHAFRETIKQIKLGNVLKKNAAEYLATLVTRPPKSFTKIAYEEALKRTFQTPLTKRGDVIGDVTNLAMQLKKIKKLNPLIILQSQYFTFLRTPANIAGTAAERLPGLKRILTNHRVELEAGGARAQMAKARAAMGWAFMTVFVPLGYFGMFHGSDVNERGRKKYPLREAANMQPKSFRFHNFLNKELQELIGLKGSKIQVSFNGFEPAVLIASVCADLGVLLRNFQEDHNDWGDVQDFFAGYALSIADNIGNSMFMQGAARLIDLISMMRLSNSGWDLAERESDKLVSGLMPYNIFLKQFNDLGSAKKETEKWGLRNVDDFAKLNLEFISMVQKNIPGFENNLRLKTDWLGDEVQKFGMVTDMEEHAVNKEARKIGYVPTKVRKKLQVTVEEGDVLPITPIQVNVELTEDELADLSYATGKLVKAYLNELINTDNYKEQTIMTVKLALFEDEVSRAKTDVKDIFKQTKLWSKIYERAKKLAIKKVRSEQQGYPVNLEE